MTAFDEAVLLGAMRFAQARELLDNVEYSSRLRMDEFYDLLLRAGYDPELSQRAARQRGWDRLAMRLEA